MGNTKNDLSVTSLALMLLVLTMQGKIVAQDPGATAADLLKNAVRIEAQFPFGAKDGFGFIVGEEGDRVLIATADHVVRGENPGEIATVRVYFYCDKTRDIPAVVRAERYTRPRDLALIEAPRPQACEWRRDAMAPQNPPPSRGTQVTFIGRSGQWYIPTDPGKVNSEGPDPDSLVNVDLPRVRAGTSGAPLISASGIVGMIVSDTEDQVASALTVEFIRNAVRSWDRTWSLKEWQTAVGKKYSNPKDGFTYVWIPPGIFKMGCVQVDSVCWDDEPQHDVQLTKGYWMSTTEVTVDAFRLFTRHTPTPMPPEPSIQYPNTPIPSFNPGWRLGDHPIVGVTWREAAAFCDWAGGRLPSEAEWERAARGGHDGRIFPWGNVITHDDANYGPEGTNGTFKSGKDRWTYTAPVKSFAPNDYGLYDMAGNVHEWVADWWDPGYYQRPEAKIDPKGPASGTMRVIRGGCWDHGADGLHISHRPRFTPESRPSSVGFRCVLDKSVEEVMHSNLDENSRPDSLRQDLSASRQDPILRRVGIRIDTDMLGTDMLVDGKLFRQQVQDLTTYIELPIGPHVITIRRGEKECSTNAQIMENGNGFFPLSCPQRLPVTGTSETDPIIDPVPRSTRVYVVSPRGWTTERIGNTLRFQSTQSSEGSITLDFCKQPRNVSIEDYLSTHEARYRKLAADMSMPIRVQRVHRYFGTYKASAVVARIGFGGDGDDAVLEAALILIEGDDHYLEASLMARQTRLAEATQVRQNIADQMIRQQLERR
jgi:formylglycine-generating enzyme required for sulfatase activity